MVYNVNSLGLDGTANIIRQLLADQSGPDWSVEKIADDEPVMTAGLGMTSLEAVEFLVELEKTFGIKLKDLNWWIYDTPTIRQVAQQLIDEAEHPEVHVSRKPR